MEGVREGRFAVSITSFLSLHGIPSCPGRCRKEGAYSFVISWHACPANAESRAFHFPFPPSLLVAESKRYEKFLLHSPTLQRGRITHPVPTFAFANLMESPLHTTRARTAISLIFQHREIDPNAETPGICQFWNTAPLYGSSAQRRSVLSDTQTFT